jgi:flavin reductase (DIM6/NTAB) family NADH-FMN oxidoreductase RutF
MVAAVASTPDFKSRKRRFPLSRAYQLLEPGPVLLLTTAYGGRRNVMTMSWHCMLEFEPPLVGCVVSDRDHSYGLLRMTRDCVLNIPTAELAAQVVGCGNTSGERVDKFQRFGLTPRPASKVGAPLIDECFASLECRLADTAMASKYGLFVLEVVAAWVDPEVKEPRTLHHRGYGRFMIGGETIRLRSKMR